MTNHRGLIWRNGEIVSDSFPLDDLDVALADPSQLVWLDIVDPDPAKLEMLAAELGLDRHAVEDTVAAAERVKLSRHPNHLFLTTYATKMNADREASHHSRLAVSKVSAFILPHGLVTVRTGDGLDIEQVVERWRDESHLLNQGVGALLHGLLDVIVDGHFETIQHLDDVVEDLEDGLFAGEITTLDMQQRVHRLRRELVELRRIVLPMREVVAAIMRRKLVGDNGDNGDNGEEAGARTPRTGSPLDGWYDDLYDHVLRAAEWTESLRDMVSGLFETNLALQDARLNTVMKKLAGWAAVIAVPTAVTGWFGQNLPYPGYATMTGLWMSVLIIVVGTVGLYLTFRHYDWI